jgi:hypothetical protein
VRKGKEEEIHQESREESSSFSYTGWCSNQSPCDIRPFDASVVPTASPIRTAQPTTRPTPPRGGSNDGSYSSSPVTPVPTSVVVTDAPTPIITTDPTATNTNMPTSATDTGKPHGVPDDIVNAQCPYLVTDGCAGRCYWRAPLVEPEAARCPYVSASRGLGAPTPAVVTSAPTSVVVSNVPTPATNTGPTESPTISVMLNAPTSSPTAVPVSRTPQHQHRHSSSYLVTDICASISTSVPRHWRFPYRAPIPILQLEYLLTRQHSR